MKDGMDTAQSKTNYNSLKWWLLAALAAMAIAVYLVVHFWGPLGAWTVYWYDWVTDRHKLKAALRAAGPMAPVLFVAMQALQVVFAPHPR